LTPAGVDAWWFGVSRDGRQFAYIVRQADKEENPSERRITKNELWKKSLVDGKETLLMPADDYFRFVPHWSPDGTRLAYQRSRPTKPGSSEREWTPVILPADGGVEEPLMTNSAHIIGAGEWTSDGQWLLGLRQNPSTNRFEIGLFPLAAAPQIETGMRVIASDAKYNLVQLKFSPDERWISFNAISYAGISTINVVPATGGKWTQITEGKYWDDKARWAPDGKVIYFISDRTGFLNVWGIRFDHGKGKPVGEPFQVTAFESPRRMIFPRVSPLEMAIAGGRLFVNITEASGSVWVLENVDR
jgi:Tol biopolymer transport system component